MEEIVGVKRVAKLLWPDFVEEAGLVLLASDPGCADRNADSVSTATELEAVCTHVHILDWFETGASRVGALVDGEISLFNRDHPDFEAACILGRCMLWTWNKRLEGQFPGVHFRIYYTELDNPIVRFHKVREGEPPWRTDAMVEETEPPDRTAVLDTRTGRLLESHT